jgi:DNA polymerase-1
MKKLLIFDGNSVVNRAFYAIKTLTAPDGLNTNGIYGFLNVLFKNLEEEKPDFIAVAFDVSAPTFRHRDYSLYKAQRKGMPGELAEQMPVLKNVLNAMNIPVLELAGYEADDIIGTVSSKCDAEGIKCKIVTGDKDDLQLVTENTSVLLSTTSKGLTNTDVYGVNEVLDRYGIEPVKLIDAKGLMGDASDNIPGVAGVGEKTALTLIAKYGSLENVFENLDGGEIKGALLQKLKDGKDMAYLSKKLATIDKHVPLDFNISEFNIKEYDNDALFEIFMRLGFKSFINRLSLENHSSQEIKIICKDAEDMVALAKSICDQKMMYYTFSDDGFHILLEDVVYKTPYCDEIKALFEDTGIQKIGCGIKDDIVLLYNNGCKFEGDGFDVGLAAYVLNPSTGRYTLPQICEDYLGLTAEHGEGAALLPKLYKCLDEKLTQTHMKDLYYTIEHPLINILAQMQILGFRVDKDKLLELSLELSEKIKVCESYIFEYSGEAFNINSPKQLGIVLFEKLGLPIIKKTKSGYSTDIDVLEKLTGRHDIIAHIINYRHLSKLKSTYADGLLTVINRDTGRIHSSFNQTVTATGRISSTEPNLQNIPIKLEMGRQVRRVFLPEDDYVLVDADYSQIELRVLAHISDDKKMKDAFLNNFDIHTQTAAEVFGVAEFMVTPEMRGRAKAVNFGIVYGIGDFSLAQDIGVTRKVAKEYIENYLKTYSNVAKFMKDTVVFAKENGFVKTISGRRRYIPELKSSNFNVRSFGERVAMNAPIQGSAADIIKIAMINVYHALKEQAPKSRLVLQVHDELIVEAHISEVETVQRLLKDKMENAFSMSLPLKVDMKVGKSWFDTK